MDVNLTREWIFHGARAFRARFSFDESRPNDAHVQVNQMKIIASISQGIQCERPVKGMTGRRKHTTHVHSSTIPE